MSEPKLNAEHDSDDDRSVTGLLTRFSLDRRITVLVFLMTIVVVGVIASLGIPLETFPRGFEFPAVQVSVPWKDAPAQAVMDKITLPLEEAPEGYRAMDERRAIKVMLQP